VAFCCTTARQYVDPALADLPWLLAETCGAVAEP
jgi:hypothetical protein